MARRDYYLLLIYCLILFGVGVYGGRPLTMHESVLAQSSREMYDAGEWLTPTSGGRPWLERPPLPQWVTIGIGWLAGGLNKEWIVRIGPMLAGTWSVLVAAWLGQFLFGRLHGLLTGFTLATMVQFHRYSTLSEQDIFLCAIVVTAMAWFARCEFRPTMESRHPLGTRSFATLVFFLLLSGTNLVKGLIFGTTMVIAPIAIWWLCRPSLDTFRRWSWVWGWAIYFAISSIWPILVWIKHPDVVELWQWDLGGRLNGAYTNINQPWWYYPVHLLWVLFPWTFLAFVGLWQFAKEASKDSAKRFVLCWAVVPIVVFSAARGKHHHYMIHYLAAWAMLTVEGCIAFGRWLQANHSLRWWSEKWHSPRFVRTGFASLAIIYIAAYMYVGPRVDHGRFDQQFFAEVREALPAEAKLVVNADLYSMDVFRILFYMPEGTESVHNLTYLRAKSAEHPEVFVITCQRDEPRLNQLGSATRMLQSFKSRRETSPDFRLGLYRLQFGDLEPPIVLPPPVSPMQAMGRRDGPFLGMPL